MTTKNKMFICVLSSIPDANEPPYDPSPHMNGYKWKQHTVSTKNSLADMKRLMQEGVDVFLNLSDGTPDDPYSGVGLVRALEKLGAAFTGAGSKFFDPSRQQMKTAARKTGVPTPPSVFVDKVEDVDKVLRKLRFPMLVKPPHGYASVGITRESRVEDAEQLKLQLEKEIKEFGRALVEEFIVGREFTCLIAEDPDDPKNPITFKPVEFRFPEGESFKHYNMKWLDYHKMTVVPVTDRKLEKTLRDYTTRIYRYFNGNGYARCDYRMDADGNIYMLEINPNCGIFYPPTDPGSADYCLLHDKINHRKFMKMLIRSALQRQAKARSKMKQKVEKKEMAYA